MVKRNILVIVGWLLVAILLGVLSEVLMIDREEYQHQLYKIPFENDDVRRYSISIIIGCLIRYITFCNFNYLTFLLLFMQKIVYNFAKVIIN